MRILSKVAPVLALCGVVGISCLAQDGSQATEIPPTVHTPSVSPTQTPNAPTQSMIEEIEPTSIIPTIVPTVVTPLPDCQQSALVFTAEQYFGDPERPPQTDLYAVCQDGNNLRKILANSQYGFGSLDIAPDNQSLAVSAYHESSPTLMSTLFELDLTSFFLSELTTREQAGYYPKWSTDGQYLAYLLYSSTPSETHRETYIEILHLASGVKSEIHLTGLNYFDWAPDGIKAVFCTWAVPEDEPYSPEVGKVIAGDIVCDDLTHKCQLLNIAEIPNVASDPSWLPDSESLVSTTLGTGDTGNGIENKLLITDLQGDIIQEVLLNSLDSTASTATWPKSSADGKYIAYVGYDHRLHIVDLQKMTLMDVTQRLDKDTNVIVFDWLD